MKKDTGTLIIEVLIGVVILSVMVTSVIYGLEQTFKSFKKANEITKTTYLAEGLLFQEIFAPGALKDTGVFDSPFNSYAWEIKRAIDPENDNFIKATVIISNKRNHKFYTQISSFINEK